MNKRGQLGDQVLLFGFIFLLLVIGTGIVLGTYLYVGAEFPFQGVEANLLSYKIKTCISDFDYGDGKFWLEGLQGEDKSSFSLIAKKCGLDREVIEKNNLIKICVDEKNVSDCINEEDDNKIAFSTGGDFNPCGLRTGSKFLGCSMIQDGKYTIIATSKQKIRRINQ